MFFQKEFYPIVLRFFEMFSTCKAGIMPYAHGVLHMTKEDSIFSPDTVTDTAQNCPENIAKKIYPTVILQKLGIPLRGLLRRFAGALGA